MENEIKLLFRENISPILKELKEKGAKVYSISKINNYHQCPKQFYYTYINKKQQKTGVYSLLGSACHSDLEDLYSSDSCILEKNNFNNEWLKAELFDIKFPVSKGDIKGNYRKDIDTFYEYYKKRHGKFVCELGFVLKLDEIHYLTGFIDLLEFNEDGTVNIFDFKTSAMFKEDKVKKAGRQLCIYEIALEQLYGLKTITNAWEMLKYLEVKVGDNKSRILSAREWVLKSEAQIKSLMKKSGISSELIDMYISQCISENNIKLLPKEIQDKISMHTYIMDYPTTDELKKETLAYVNETIKIIEEIDINDIKAWEAKPDSFFCRNLCGYSFKECTSFYSYK